MAPLPGGRGLDGLGPEGPVEPGRQRAELSLDRVVERADHLDDGVLAGRRRADARLIGEEELDRLDAEAVVGLGAGRMAEGHLEQQPQRVELRRQGDREVVRPVPVVPARRRKLLACYGSCRSVRIVHKVIASFYKNLLKRVWIL